MLGELLTAGAGIANALFGGDSSSRQKGKAKTKSQSVTRTKSHLGQMVKQAEKYGFNPLTVLQAGGLSAYATTANVGKSNTKSSSHGSASSGSPFGQALSAVAPLAAMVSSGGTNPSGAGAAGQQAQADAWKNAPAATPYGDPATQKANEYKLVMQQLGDNNKPNAQTYDGKTPEVPSSSMYRALPMLSYTSNDPSTYFPDLGMTTKGYGWKEPEFKGADVVSPLPKFLTDRGYTLPKGIQPASAVEEYFGESEALQQLAGVLNAGALVYHNRDLIARDTGQVKDYVVDEAKAELIRGADTPLLRYEDRTNPKNSFDIFPSPNYIATETQQALKRIAPDPALSDAAGSATRRRQYMEMQGVSW